MKPRSITLVFVIFILLSGLVQAGAQNWKSIRTDGFGNVYNYSTRAFEIYNGELYVGTESFIKTLIGTYNFSVNVNSISIDPINSVNVNLTESEFNMLHGNISNEIIHISNVGVNETLIENGGCSTLGSNVFITEFGIMTWGIGVAIETAMQIRCKASTGGELWKYNYNTNSWTPVVANKPGAMKPAGFGVPYQIAVCTLKVFNGKLYAGTWGPPFKPIGYPESVRGCQIWRFDGSRWEQVANYGFGNPYNVAAWSMEVFNGYLYVGTMNWDYSSNGGAEIWRTSDGVKWERVMRKGFREYGAGDTMNTYVWDLAVYNNRLYAGTFNSKYSVTGNGMGCQLFRTSNGVSWSKVELPGGDGFGEAENYGIRKLTVYNGRLYVGTATSAFQIGTNVEACEIWRYDGSSWAPIIGDDVPGSKPGDPVYDGFGNYYNKYVWSMYVYNGRLWVGTLNYRYLGGLSFSSQGCEVWAYDGSSWVSYIKDGRDLPNGFGDVANLGARSMAEYNGKLYIGTFNLKSMYPWISEKGCDVWRYTP